MSKTASFPSPDLERNVNVPLLPTPILILTQATLLGRLYKDLFGKLLKFAGSFCLLILSWPGVLNLIATREDRERERSAVSKCVCTCVPYIEMCV